MLLLFNPVLPINHVWYCNNAKSKWLIKTKSLCTWPCPLFHNWYKNIPSQMFCRRTGIILVSWCIFFLNWTDVTWSVHLGCGSTIQTLMLPVKFVFKSSDQSTNMCHWYMSTNRADMFGFSFPFKRVSHSVRPLETNIIKDYTNDIDFYYFTECKHLFKEEIIT